MRPARCTDFASGFLPARRSKRLGLYFSPHPLVWWKQFSDVCDISMRPWGVIDSYEERSCFYALAAIVQRALPNFRLWQYPIVILDKR